MIRKSHEGYCDYCKNHAGDFVRPSEQSDRDICIVCVKDAAKLFGIKNESLVKNTLTMFNALMKRMLDGDTQTLIKAGFLNNDLSLTSKGEEEVMALILVSNKTALVQAATEKIAEDEKAKK